MVDLNYSIHQLFAVIYRSKHLKAKKLSSDKSEYEFQRAVAAAPPLLLATTVAAA
jgi:hypothetical protein